MNTDNVTFNQIVTFCILMENDQGIIDKSPNYIREKWKYCMGTTDIDSLFGILDPQGQAKFIRWRSTWKQ